MSAAQSTVWSAPSTFQPRRINIIGKSNGVGLSRDIDMLADALQSAGHEVKVIAIDAVDAESRRSTLVQLRTHLNLTWRKGRHRQASAPRVDVNLMLEHVWLQHLSTARRNIAIPNPEWFDRHDRRFLRHVDHIWAKTAYTRDVFSALGCDAAYVGFDSDDRQEPTVVKQRTYFHLAGKSTMKGTDRLLRIWSRHPEWPPLIVVQHKESRVALPAATNIQLKIGYLSDDELRLLQNQSAFHICPSLTEGWGHYIAEALSVGAVTITVDAAPMNEIVTNERGILVSFQGTGRQRLATTYQFDESALEAAVERTISMSDDERIRLGANARRWFVDNKLAFAARVEATVRALPI